MEKLLAGSQQLLSAGELEHSCLGAERVGEPLSTRVSLASGSAEVDASPRAAPKRKALNIVERVASAMAYLRMRLNV